MKVVIDASLEATPIRRRKEVLQIVSSLEVKLNTEQNHFKLVTAMPPEEADVYPALGFVGTLSTAYSTHQKMLILPQDLWFIVMCEVAKIIKANTEACRPLFTRSDDKVTIMVPTTDPTQMDLDSVMDQLTSLMPTDQAMFVPELSTLTKESRLALCAALLDGVQAYYNYMTFCCGIPEVEVGGTVADWDSLVNSADGIAKLFDSVGLTGAAGYMRVVHGVLDQILTSFVFHDSTFWKGIFTQKNIGSGGEIEINGWITELFYEKPSLRKLENFMSSIAVVPYENAETGRKFKAVYGAFGARMVDGQLQSQFTHYIYEQFDGKKPHVPYSRPSIKTLIDDVSPKS
jgi:hypothetical protein